MTKGNRLGGWCTKQLFFSVMFFFRCGLESDLSVGLIGITTPGATVAQLRAVKSAIEQIGAVSGSDLETHKTAAKLKLLNCADTRSLPLLLTVSLSLSFSLALHLLHFLLTLAGLC